MTKIIRKIKKEDGFMILFAVTVSAILLSIALGIANIAFKELKFNTSVKASNDAFFSADTGIECALINDKSTSTTFTNGGSGRLNCLGVGIQATGAYPAWTFTMSSLGFTNQGCSVVTVTKSTNVDGTIATKIVSLGYDTGGGASNVCLPTASSVEREINTNYNSGSPTAPSAFSGITNIKVTVNNGLQGYSRIVEVEAWGSGTNYALTGTASSSGDFSSGYPVSSIINGDRRGVGWGSGTGGWNDNTSNSWPDTATITFSSPKTLNEIDVYTLADGFPLASDPGPSDTFTLYGITNFNVQYSKDNGLTWADVPGSPVSSNNLIWKKFTLQ
ncbi:MAG: hypothetical protein KGL67_01205 [Patescibacteria group bacterium]|nr:hypothetical protein [Patescibacteria group bacterium]